MSRGEDRRGDILDAASGLFLKFGYRKTTLDDVADAVHIRKSSLYHYFTGKEELFREVVRSIREEHIETLEELFEKPLDIRRTLIEFAHGIIEFRVKYKLGFDAFWSEYTEVMPLIQADNEICIHRLASSLIRRFEKAVREGELRPIKTDKMVSVLLFIISSAMKPSYTGLDYERIDEYIEFMVDLLIDHYYIHS